MLSLAITKQLNFKAIHKNIRYVLTFNFLESLVFHPILSIHIRTVQQNYVTDPPQNEN